REIVGVCLGALIGIGLIVSVFRLTDAQWQGLSSIDHGRLIRIVSPGWLPRVRLSAQLWFWSEFLVMFSNHRRRALQDFRAGTIVMKQPQKPAMDGVAELATSD